LAEADLAAVEATATITLVSFGLVVARSGGHLAADPFVNPQRCVYVITVHAPFTPEHPAGVTLPTYDVYSVVVDEATGVHIAGWAGGDLTAAVRQG
jgi:hypothetical protein